MSPVRKFAFIDALRGYAVLGVLLVHASQHVAPANAALQALMDTGARGVQLFYLASALTLCMSWESRSTDERAPARNFYLRRLFRIAPLFWVAIAAYLLLDGVGPRYWAPEGVAWWHVPLTAAFANGFLPETITSIVPGGWSIAVEMTFYLVLPALIETLRTLPARLCFLAGTLVLCAVNRFAVLHWLAPHYPEAEQYLVSQFAYLNFLGQAPVFALGLVTVKLLEDTERTRRIAAAAGTTLLAGCLVCIALLPATSLPFRICNHYLVFSVGLAGLTLCLAGQRRGLLINPLATWFGRISFSMYLTQFASFELLAALGIERGLGPGIGPALVYFAFATALTAAISSLTFRWIERPGIALGRRLIDRLEGRAAQPGPRLRPGNP